MTIERTLAIIKPDAVANNYIGKITMLIEEKKLAIIAAKMLHLSIADAKELYAEHKGRPFYASLLRFMTSGPVIVEVLEGDNAVQTLRDIMGSTIPREAEEGTIRNLYAAHDSASGVHENAIHGSDSRERAKKEIDFFFAQNEICTRTR